jgi:phage-related protein
MSYSTYTIQMRKADKLLLWLHGEVKTPPFSAAARIEAGVLLRRLQRGETIALPHSRPMPDIGKACHELRVNDETRTWRIVYHRDVDAVVILEVFSKTSRATPDAVMKSCRKRLQHFLAAAYDKETKR